MVAGVTEIALCKIYEGRNGGRGAHFRRIKMKVVTTFKI